jgi:hypothetical protein
MENEMQVSMQLTQFRKPEIYAAISTATGAIIDCGAAIGAESLEIFESGSKGPLGFKFQVQRLI